MIEELIGIYIHMVTKGIPRLNIEDSYQGAILLDQVGIVNELYLLIQ